MVVMPQVFAGHPAIAAVASPETHGAAIAPGLQAAPAGWLYVIDMAPTAWVTFGFTLAPTVIALPNDSNAISSVIVVVLRFLIVDVFIFFFFS